MGVCDAIEDLERPTAPHNITQQNAALPTKKRPDLGHHRAQRETPAMTVPHVPKVAGIEPALPAPTHTVDPRVGNTPASPTAGTPYGGSPATLPGAPRDTAPDAASDPAPGDAPDLSAVDQLTAVQDRLAGWISDLSTLHHLTEQLARTRTLEDALHELLRAGASLVGARRGLAVLAPADGYGPETTIGLGLGHADIGTIETIPRRALSYARILDGLPEPGAGGDGTRPAAGDAGRPPAPAARRRPDRAPRSPNPTSPVRRGSTRACGRSRPGSGTPPVTRSRSPPTPSAGPAPRSGSTTNRPSPPNGSAISSASTGRTPPNTSPASWSCTAAGRPYGSSARSCCRTGCRGSPASGSRCGTAAGRAAAATGTTRCRCRTAHWGWPSVR